PLGARIMLIWEPVTQPRLTFPIHRAGSVFQIHFVPGTIWESRTLWKIPSQVLGMFANLVFTLCALLVSLRRSDSREARALALAMLLTVFVSTTPGSLALPAPSMALALWFVARAALLAVSLLLVRFSSQFGTRSPWRTLFEWIAYAACAVRFAITVVPAVAVVTLAFDPIPFLLSRASLIFQDGTAIWIALVAVVAVACSNAAQRPRAAWLLLPLPVAIACTTLAAGFTRFVTSWYAFVTFSAVSSTIMLAGALFVTYALLGRRVLDVGFVLTRSIVVAIVSLIVVSSFVLLEWVLGSFLAGASHATGVAANAALALALGLSMRFIHKRVDEFVDGVMFRKRHEDESAIRDFSKEAAYITDRDALLDQTIGKLRNHTDALACAILMSENGTFKAVRWFGETAGEAGENDSAILALKTWHKPIDPHRYETTLRGDLALPMVARGRLIGLLLCGERASGEAYAPDEVDAVATLVHGVGAAYDALGSRESQDARAGLVDAIRELRETVAALTAAVERPASERRS
ncbi:MAG TPA: hypothetical protein VK760_13090, partial [Candidatus Acidoferrales bacterium]|nr:hypothetical protein [Candidatus Acidoferrales bacterium]